MSRCLATVGLPRQLHQHVPNIEDGDCNVELAADQSQVLLKRAESSLAKHRISTRCTSNADSDEYLTQYCSGRDS